jgi:hypothetical protein
MADVGKWECETERGCRSPGLCADSGDCLFHTDDTNNRVQVTRNLIEGKTVYTLQAGRSILKNGVPMFTLHGAIDTRINKMLYDPVELDDTAKLIVQMLNAVTGSM